MKIKAAALTFLMVLVFNPAALARKNPDRPFFFLPSPVTINGAEVPTGMYQLTLVTSNASVHVELWKDGKFVATARGTWVKNGVKFKDNTILLKVNPDGSRSLIELRLAGIAKTIVLNTSSDAIMQYSAK